MDFIHYMIKPFFCQLLGKQGIFAKSRGISLFQQIEIR
ncbi:hypothetical protein BREVNS_2410 [Brevinematales bacterium NS]|nr:hypothetical protein BREVNS_2410 [Brevinematales bacterium NS]